MKITVRKYLKKDLPIIKQYFENIYDEVIAQDPLKRIRKMPGLIDVFFKKLLKDIRKN